MVGTGEVSGVTNEHDEQPLGPRAGEPVPGRRVGSGAEEPRQDTATGPFVEHPDLPAMGERDLDPRPVRGEIRLMDESTATTSGSGRGRGEMPSAPNGRGSAPPATGDHPPQEPVQSRAANGDAGGYLRFHVRVDDGVMSIVAAKRVPGPLGPSAPMHGGLAYEVSLGPDQLSAGDVPDPGVRRGFVPPDEPNRGHHVVEVSSYEFAARVPADRLSRVNLPDVEVAVYRLDASQAVHATQDQPLRVREGQAAVEVARLNGIHVEQLPAEVRDSIEQALG
jgi:hypothetical protein